MDFVIWNMETYLTLPWITSQESDNDNEMEWNETRWKLMRFQEPLIYTPLLIVYLW